MHEGRARLRSKTRTFFQASPKGTSVSEQPLPGGLTCLVYDRLVVLSSKQLLLHRELPVDAVHRDFGYFRAPAPVLDALEAGVASSSGC